MKTFAGILSALLIILSVNCKKNQDELATTSVNFYIYLNQPDAFDLNAVGGHKYYNAGLRGVIVYRRSPSEFVAFERNCTYDPNASNAIVEVDSSGLQLIDYSCGSKFSIYDGAVNNGPAVSSLRQYFTEYSSANNTVHVTN